MRKNKATETGCGSQSLKYLPPGPKRKSLLTLITEQLLLYFHQGYSSIQFQSYTSAFFKRVKKKKKSSLPPLKNRFLYLAEFFHNFIQQILVIVQCAAYYNGLSIPFWGNMIFKHLLNQTLNPNYTLESPNYVPAPLRLTRSKSLVGKQWCLFVLRIFNYFQCKVECQEPQLNILGMAYFRNDICFTELVSFNIGILHLGSNKKLSFLTEILSGYWVSKLVYQNLFGSICI